MRLTLETIEEAGMIAIYISVQEGQVGRTEEVWKDEGFVDFDRRGHVVGIELVTPGKLESHRIIRKIPVGERRQVREAFRKAAHVLSTAAA